MCPNNLGLIAYLCLQLTVLVRLVLRTKLQDGLVRDVAMTATVVYFCLNVVSVLNNPIFFLDLQVLIWMLVASALTLGRDLVGGVVPLRDSSSGRLSLVTDLRYALSVIWRRRPAVLVTPQRPPGYRIASSLSGIPLVDRSNRQ